MDIEPNLFVGILQARVGTDDNISAALHRLFASQSCKRHSNLQVLGGST